MPSTWRSNIAARLRAAPWSSARCAAETATAPTRTRGCTLAPAETTCTTTGTLKPTCTQSSTLKHRGTKTKAPTETFTTLTHGCAKRSGTQSGSRTTMQTQEYEHSPWETDSTDKQSPNMAAGTKPRRTPPLTCTPRPRLLLLPSSQHALLPHWAVLAHSSPRLFPRWRKPITVDTCSTSTATTPHLPPSPRQTVNLCPLIMMSWLAPAHWPISSGGGTQVTPSQRRSPESRACRWK